MSAPDHSAKIAPGAVGAWAALLNAPLPEGWRREEVQTRFDQPELRLWRGEDWAVSAVQHPDWVLLYLRRPFFGAATIDPRTVSDQFPAARIDKGAVKLRVNDAAEARALLSVCLPSD